MAKKNHQGLDANLIAQNKKARHDYTVTDTFEAGLVLTGTEIKSVRARRVTLKDGYAQFHNGELWLMNVHIAEFAGGNIFNHDPLRNRKLLLHKKELKKLQGELTAKGGYPRTVKNVLETRLRQGALGPCSREARVR